MISVFATEIGVAVGLVSAVLDAGVGALNCAGAGAGVGVGVGIPAAMAAAAREAAMAGVVGPGVRMRPVFLDPVFLDPVFLDPVVLDPSRRPDESCTMNLPETGVLTCTMAVGLAAVGLAAETWGLGQVG